MKALLTILSFLFCVQVFSQVSINAQQAQQLDSLVEDFQKWYAEKSKPKKKWYSLDIQDAGIILCGGFGGYWRGVNEAILFREYGKGSEFWDIDISFKRKYKDFDGGDLSEAFLGSKTIFVGFTDGYHLTNMAQTMCYVGGALCIAFSDIKKYDKPFLAISKKLLLFGIANGLMFRVAYK